MNIQDLYLYPIKSLGGIRIEKGSVLEKGFDLDRRLMLVDHTNQFITQRVEHNLALLKTTVTTTGVQVTNNISGETIEIPFDRTLSGEHLSVNIWDDKVEAVKIGEEFDEWFSKYLGKPVKLVYQPALFGRAVDTKYAKHGEQVSFADAFPYMLIGQASLDDLNSRLDCPVPMNRFRPSIVVGGTVAFEEDTWEEIEIGEVRFSVAKPCARCVLTTVDQETAIKGKEPLATLAKFRTFNNKVMFGQNLLALNEGTIEVGDSVKVIKKKP